MGLRLRLPKGSAMHYSLVMIGAHDGSKTLPHIREASGKGRVLLVEPVPFLFRRLEKAVSGIPNIDLANICVSLVDGDVEFTAPKESAMHGGDQLGSLNARHAVDHLKEMSEHVETILAKSMTFGSLVRTYGITSVETLFTDMEGSDCELLPTFPFASIAPMNILFEYKHSDGTFRVGKRLGMLLIALDFLGYDVTVLDVENLLAKRRAPAAPAA